MSEQQFLIPTDENQQAELPVGEGFPRTGFIGGWQARVMYKTPIYIELDLQKELEDQGAELPSALDDVEALVVNGQAFDARAPSRDSRKFVYYYKDKERAQECCKLIDAIAPQSFKQSPQQCWYFEAQLTDILSLTDEAREKFSGPTLAFDVRIVTLGSKKYRHAYHFLALPAFISAYAKAYGRNVPEFDLSPLTAPDDEIVFNKETEFALIGDSDEYASCHFWQERVKVWAALGEENPENNYLKDNESKYATSSADLSLFLQATLRPWTSLVYCRLIPIPNPKLSEAYEVDDEKKQPSIPVIAEIFASREAAEAVALAERADQAEEAASQSADSSGESTVPQAWVSAEDAWVKEVKNIKDELTGPPPTWGPQLEAIVEEDSRGYPIGATLEELTAWVNKV